MATGQIRAGIGGKKSVWTEARTKKLVHRFLLLSVLGYWTNLEVLGKLAKSYRSTVVAIRDILTRELGTSAIRSVKGG